MYPKTHSKKFSIYFVDVFICTLQRGGVCCRGYLEYVWQSLELGALDQEEGGGPAARQRVHVQLEPQRAHLYTHTPRPYWQFIHLLKACSPVKLTRSHLRAPYWPCRRQNWFYKTQPAHLYTHQDHTDKFIYHLKAYSYTYTYSLINAQGHLKVPYWQCTRQNWLYETPDSSPVHTHIPRQHWQVYLFIESL